MNGPFIYLAWHTHTQYNIRRLILRQRCMSSSTIPEDIFYGLWLIFAMLIPIITSSSSTSLLWFCTGNHIARSFMHNCDLWPAARSTWRNRYSSYLPILVCGCPFHRFSFEPLIAGTTRMRAVESRSVLLSELNNRKHLLKTLSFIASKWLILGIVVLFLFLFFYKSSSTDKMFY